MTQFVGVSNMVRGVTQGGVESIVADPADPRDPFGVLGSLAPVN